MGYCLVKTRFVCLGIRQWLQSMCGITPKAIITNQCQAMWWAIEIVFLESVILCRHVLFVFFQETVTVLPERYILDW
jgi:hypothetical protein